MLNLAIFPPAVAFAVASSIAPWECSNPHKLLFRTIGDCVKRSEVGKSCFRILLESPSNCFEYFRIF